MEQEKGENGTRGTRRPCSQLACLHLQKSDLGAKLFSYSGSSLSSTLATNPPEQPEINS